MFIARDIKKKDTKRNDKGMNFLFSNTEIFSDVKAMCMFDFYAKSFYIKGLPLLLLFAMVFAAVLINFIYKCIDNILCISNISHTF